MFARVVAAGAVITLVLSACSPTDSAPPAATTVTSAIGSPEEILPETTSSPTTTPSPSPTPVPQSVALTGEALRGAALTASDLGDGWKVNKRSQKATTFSKKERQETSPECRDFVTFLFGGAIAKDDPTSAFIEISRGKNLGVRSVTELILPMPDGGFAAFESEGAFLLEECPSITFEPNGNSLGSTTAFKKLDIPGFEDTAFGMEGVENAFFLQFQYYRLFAAAPVGENIVVIISGWSQRSRKTLASVLTKAVNKVATAAGVESPAN